MSLWRLLVCLLIAGVRTEVSDSEETDGQSSRKILGSSVVTSVSVVMETGNGKHTYYSDALGHPLSKPHIASQVASPINLLNPDRYEFYTFNDDGELVKRLMTLEEIQGIIAGGDGESINYNSENSQILSPNNDVSGVVENVQNVLKEEIESHRNPPLDRPIMDTPDVSSTWNMILPAFFGDSMMSDAVTIRESDKDSNNYISISQKNNDISTTEHMKMSSRMPEESEGNVLSNEYNLPVEITTVFTTDSRTQQQTQNNKEPLSTVPFNFSSATTEKMDKSTSMTTSESSLPTMQDIFTLDMEKFSTVTEALDAATEEIIDDGPAAGKTASAATTEDSKTTNTVPLITERVNAHASTIEAEPSTVDQTIDYPKITELVSMITRPTTKPNTKITSTMSTTSVTFPQFTEFEQISPNSTTRLPASEAASTTAADIVSDDFVILPQNSDNKNDNLPADSNTSTAKYQNNESTTSYLENTTQNITANVEQFIADLSNDIINKNANVPVVEYNATTIIEDILNSPTKSPELSNKIMTLASFILDRNRINANTPITESTIKTSESESTAASKESTMSLQEISTTRPIPQTTRKNVVSSTTIRQPTRPISSTLLEKQNPPITSTSSTTPKLQTTTQSKPSTTKKTTTNIPSTKITTTIPTKTTERTTTKLAQSPSTTTTIKSTLPPTTTTTKTTQPPTTAIKTTQPPTAITLRTTQATSAIPITESQKPLTDSILANRFGIESTELTNPSSTSTQFTKIIQTTSTTGVTKPKTTTERMTTPFIVTSTKKLTTESSKPQTTASSTIKPTTSPVTFITIKQNKTLITTTNKPTSTTKVRVTTLNTSPTTKRTTITSTTNNPTKTSGTATTLSSTTANATTFEPSRKTEEVLFDKMTTINDAWKLVETVKPPETSPTKTVNSTSPIPIITTSKPSYRPSIEPYQPTKVDLSSQGNFGMPALSEDMSMFSKMYNELALKFWNALSVKDINSDRSAVVSPFGAISMLAMIFLGARGGTSNEMNDVLKLDDIVTFNPHLVIKEVTDSVIARKSSSAIVRELYSDMYRGKVTDFYKERVRFFYEGHVEEIDFKKIHNVIRRRTNSLISKQTRGQLPQYLEETTLSLRAPLSALSTNVFQADCSEASIEGRDGELYFIVLPSIRQRRLVPIPAAVWRSGFIAGYDPELDATAVSLGTMNQAVSTVFVMPGQQGHSAPGDVLLRLEARLLNTTYIPETWNQLLKSMLPRPGLEIQLPRFLHKSVINTTDAFKRMGLREMFNKNKANFQGLNGKNHDLYFSDMMQVNEFSICGDSPEMHTEIYPSVIEHLQNHNEQMRNFKYMDYFEENEYDKYLSIPLPLRPRQARLPEVPRLRFDRPFLYFVRHNPTGLILHMGRFNPRLLT